MSEELKDLVPPTKLSTLQKLVRNIEYNTVGDVDVGFEYLIASLFPTCWNNIQEELARQAREQKEKETMLQIKQEYDRKVSKDNIFIPTDDLIINIDEDIIVKDKNLPLGVKESKDEDEYIDLEGDIFDIIEEKAKVDEPEVEDVEAEAPKVEVVKTVESEAEEVKTEEPNVEEVKVEETAVEEVKNEEPKAEEVKAEESKAEDVKAKASKVEEVKTEEPKVEEAKTEEPKIEENTDDGLIDLELDF